MSSQNWTSFRGHFYVDLGRINVQNGDLFGGLQNFKYFGVLDFPYIFWVKQ